MATKITGEVGTVRYGRDGRSKTTELLTDEPNVVLSVFSPTAGAGPTSPPRWACATCPTTGRSR
jgi:hypothetical protein